MEADVIAGCALIGAALAVLTLLVLWSRRMIHRIARKGYGSAREIHTLEQEND
ncbi:MAG: hypothetical protein KGZ25_02140 [Planctomycetes bacterium]|nr:hypothetical protein [Planctomycetota bacterium]